MRLPKLILTIFLVAISLFLFSSCSDRTKWKNAELDYKTEAVTRTDGSFRQEGQIIAEKDIWNYDSKDEYLLDIDFREGVLKISNLFARDRDKINYLRITLNRRDYYEVSSLYPNSKGEIYISDSKFNDFMEELVYQLSNDGFVNIVIEGKSNIIGGESIYFDLGSLLEILVEY